MKVITTIKHMQEYSTEARKSGRTIGFVPTMGYLHEGHLSLLRAAKKECDIVVLSIFVNKIQFGPNEDYNKYPRDIQHDKDMAEKEMVDVVFAPLHDEMYSSGFSTYVDVTGSVSDVLCGSSRPGHFKGVATVVTKLFNIVMPHKSYFGQKDAQQAVVIKHMARDMNSVVEIRVMPIVREADGLAMSSRNKYLSSEERKNALRLPEALMKARRDIAAGEVSAKRIKQKIKDYFKKGNGIRIEYIEIIDRDNLNVVEIVKANTLIAAAVFVGKVRLIDNIETIGPVFEDRKD
ncbi:MAG: pantoate--beta-alanine ligase [Candidatus Omnitrophota bacterium]